MISSGVAKAAIKVLVSSISEVIKPVLSKPRRARLSTLTVLPSRTKLVTDMLLWTITARVIEDLELVIGRDPEIT